jgi:hypothetical protein
VRTSAHNRRGARPTSGVIPERSKTTSALGPLDLLSYYPGLRHPAGRPATRREARSPPLTADVDRPGNQRRPASAGIGRSHEGRARHLQPRVGPKGIQLVPDLAICLPNPTDEGRTYTFRLRPGIRYSDRRRLHAADFRRAIERLFRVGSDGRALFDGIRAAASCDPPGAISHGESSRTRTREP